VHPPLCISAIIFQLDRELEKVNTFYVYKSTLIDRRLWILSEKYDTENSDDVEELALALRETRIQMNKLLSFSDMNSKGFKKILKK
jgi:glycerophosphodiester phosphodiesterase